MGTQPDMLPTPEFAELMQDVVQVLAINRNSPLRLLGSCLGYLDAAAERPLELEDVQGLSVLNLSITELFQFLPKGQPLRHPDLELCVRAALLCSLQAHPRLARQSGFLPRKDEALSQDELWDHAWRRLREWLQSVFRPAIQKGSSIETLDELTPREARLIGDWRRIAQGSALPIDGPLFLRVMDEAWKATDSFDDGQSQKPADSSDEYQRSKHRRGDLSGSIDWLANITDRDIGFYYRGRDGSVRLGMRQLRDSLRKKLGANVCEPEHKSLHDPVREGGSLRIADATPQERELAPDEALAAREIRDLLLDELDGVDDATKAAVVYELARGDQSIGPRSRNEIADAFGVQPHQVEYRGPVAEELVRRLLGRFD